MVGRWFLVIKLLKYLGYSPKILHSHEWYKQNSFQPNIVNSATAISTGILFFRKDLPATAEVF